MDWDIETGRIFVGWESIQQSAFSTQHSAKQNLLATN